MSLLTELTQLEIDLRAKDESVLRCAEVAHGLAVALKNEHARFWSLPTDRLLDVLNHNVPSTLAMFAANSAAGQTINALLDQVNDPRFSTRAPIATGRTDIVFDGTTFSVQVDS